MSQSWSDGPIHVWHDEEIQHLHEQAAWVRVWLMIFFFVLGTAVAIIVAMKPTPAQQVPPQPLITQCVNNAHTSDVCLGA